MLKSAHQLGARPASPCSAVVRITGGGELAIASSVGSGAGLGDGSRMLATVRQRGGLVETEGEGEKWVELETWAGTVSRMGLGDVWSVEEERGEGNSRGARREAREGVVREPCPQRTNRSGSGSGGAGRAAMGE